MATITRICEVCGKDRQIKATLGKPLPPPDPQLIVLGNPIVECGCPDATYNDHDRAALLWAVKGNA